MTRAAIVWPLLAWPIHVSASISSHNWGADSDSSSIGSSAPTLMLVCGIVGMFAGWLYAKNTKRRRSDGSKFATDGCVIVGGLVGVFVLPFIWIALTK